MLCYGGLPEEYTRYHSSDIIIIPVPYDKTSTWIKGADKGPEALLSASENMELFDIETETEVFRRGIHTCDPVTTLKDPEFLAGLVKKSVSGCLKDRKTPVIIGGEHSVSIGAFQAFSETFENLTILQLDAHADMRKSYEGSSYNHACVMSRAKELAPVIQVGIRSMSIEEKEEVDRGRIIYAHEMNDNSHWIEKVLSLLTQNVYLTVDLDVFDPSIVPATGTPEPGGPGYGLMLNLLKKVIMQSNIVGFDIVELCPIENHKASEFLASKLLYQILSYKYQKANSKEKKRFIKKYYQTY